MVFGAGRSCFNVNVKGNDLQKHVTKCFLPCRTREKCPPLWWKRRWMIWKTARTIEL